jgi:2-keto-4-pentenoate hydratase/2-oxohepta-3-ene-1,7-dioic acid hydratase in catechol pathway
MRFVRYLYGSDAPRYGWIYEDRIGPVDGSPVGDYRRLEADIPIEKVKLLAPILPGKIVCVGRNYVEHAKEQSAELPDVPLLFLKPLTSVIGPATPILLPPQSQRVDHEGELAVVIGQGGRWIPIERAMQHVFGYTCANDVTARDLQRRDGQWTRAKGFDTFCPLGPWIETELEYEDTLITCHVNQEMRQMASTNEMVFSVAQLITFVSSVMTLEPGDVLLTGTPAGIGPLEEGDVVEVNIDGIGALRNPVRKERGS